MVEADDFDAAVAFYRDALGLPEEFAVENEGGTRVIALQAGRATLEIVNPAQRRLIEDLKVGRDVSRSIHVAFEVTDAPAATDALVAAGATLTAAPLACRRGLPADAPGDRRATASVARRSTATMSIAGPCGPGRAEPR